VKNVPALQVADVATVKPAVLEAFLQHEVQAWRERFCWNMSDLIYRLRLAVERGGLSGSVLQAGTRTLGCALYLISGHLGVISHFVISPECGAGAAEMLVQETVRALRRAGASRIEGPFISVDVPGLCQLFEREGFSTYWREFLRYERCPTLQSVRPPANLWLEGWRRNFAREAATIMLAAYEGGVDAELNQQYRTQGGCELVLDDVLNQGICGNPVVKASAMAQQRGQGIGFIILTEIGPQHAHVAQVAVLPSYQHQGIGRLLLNHALSRLADCGFTAVSLIATRLNRRALEMYKLIGFKPALSFPVFAWQG
jgi:ribosomal protein S18 acetylase RimI-like enzyme